MGGQWQLPVYFISYKKRRQLKTLYNNDKNKFRNDIDIEKFTDHDKIDDIKLTSNEIKNGLSINIRSI